MHRQPDTAARAGQEEQEAHRQPTVGAPRDRRPAPTVRRRQTRPSPGDGPPARSRVRHQEMPKDLTAG
eukprot:11501729-Alexandrium_andersonii.AAC.1